MKTSDKIIDGQLVSRCKSGDKKAFTELVKRWHLRFCNQAFWYTKDKDLAKDVVQEAWTIIFKKLDALHDHNSFGSWSLNIVNRKSIDAMRTLTKTGRKLRSYYRDIKYNDEHLATNKITIDDANNDVNHHSRIIIKTIKKLPEDHQIVLRLFYVEDYTILEISELLNVSKGTVKSRLFYAREKLKSIIKNKDHEKS